MSRRMAFLPLEVGDGLWVVAVYLGYSTLCPDWPTGRRFLLALLTSFLVEFSQLLQWNWLVAIWQTPLGHLFLGQGFLWRDLLAYSLGLVTIFVCDDRIIALKTRE
ncbi:hypothetical protein ABID29_001062 [Streptococcus rupicaprae]|uniref:DUF2809 domain-containing protein n=1 Tax=Streptococcus rupicaprae TaxID=759619 RepID=A0ABV2FHB1_9STRE